MKLQLSIKLDNPSGLPITFSDDYHASIMSLIKNLMKGVDMDAYRNMYLSNTPKLFTWSLSFPRGTKHDKDTGMFTMPMGKNIMTLLFSFYREEDYMLFSSMFSDTSLASNLIHNPTLFGYDYSIHRIKVVQKDALYPMVVVKTVSNAMFLNMKKKDKDNPYSYLTKFSLEDYRESLINKLKYAGLDDMIPSANTLAVVPSKEVLRWPSLYGSHLPAISGYFALVGDKQLVNFIVSSGLGAETGSGFGSLQVVTVKNG